MSDTETEANSPPRKSARHEVDGASSPPSGARVEDVHHPHADEPHARPGSTDGCAPHTRVVSGTGAPVTTTWQTSLVNLPDVHMRDASMNGILAMSGPRGGGAIHARSAQSSLAALRLAADDPIYRAIADAWEKVLVPAEQYWGVYPSSSGDAGGIDETRRVATGRQEESHTHTHAGEASSMTELHSPFAPVHATCRPHTTTHTDNRDRNNNDDNSSASHHSSHRGRMHHPMSVHDASLVYSPATPVAARIPDPHHLPLTFYGGRTDAMAGRGYECNHGNVVAAVDRRYGNGSKLFNIFPRVDYARGSRSPARPTASDDARSDRCPRASVSGPEMSHGSDLGTFMAAIPHAHDRNMYVLVDETAAIDPYFDIDYCYTAPLCAAAAGPSSKDNSGDAVKEDGDGTTTLGRSEADTGLEHNSSPVEKENDACHGAGRSCVDHTTSERASLRHGHSSNSNKEDAHTRTTCDVPWQTSRHDTPAALRADVEATLWAILTFLQAELEQRLHTRLSQCLVLTSSVQIWRRTAPAVSSDERCGLDEEDETEGARHSQAAHANTSSSSRLLEVKLSVHVHFRLRHHHALHTVKDMHHLMSDVRAKLDARLAQASPDVHTGGGEKAREADMAIADDVHTLCAVRRCVDFGVYTRWRAFRLPYNVKSPLLSAQHTAAHARSETAEAEDVCIAAGAGLTAVDAAVDDLLRGQLEALGIVAPSVEVGEVASSVMPCIELAHEPGRCAEQCRLLRKLFHLFRFLLPVVPAHTRIDHVGLRQFLERYHFCPSMEKHHERAVNEGGGNAEAAAAAALLLQKEEEIGGRETMIRAVMDLACIQRDNPHPYRLSSTAVMRSRRGAETALGSEEGSEPPPGADTTLSAAAANGESDRTEETASTMLRLLQYSSGRAATTAASADAGPFALTKPPLPHSVRISIHDVHIKQLLGQVLACLSPQYGFAVHKNVVLPDEAASPGDAEEQAQQAYTRAQSSRLQVQYEAAIRAYYVYQKQSKYCLRLNRYHRSTYAQLYLTYGSIKVRCYSNDCYHRCLYVSWHNHTETMQANRGGAHDASDPLPNIPGYPCYALLHVLHKTLFPPLPTEELVRRYGMNVLTST